MTEATPCTLRVEVTVHVTGEEPDLARIRGELELLLDQRDADLARLIRKGAS